MALQKQSVTFNFNQGIDRKTDPFQIPLGKFFLLRNSIFDKGGLFEKRNGYTTLTPLPNTSSTLLTTFRNNLTAVGTSIYAYDTGSATWNNKGTLEPLQLSTSALIRNTFNQTQCDAQISSNGLVCTVYTESQPDGAGGVILAYKYVISSQSTGQNIKAPVPIPVGSGVVQGSPRVFVLGRNFIIVFDNLITGVHHLQYVSINISNPTSVSGNVNISSVYSASSKQAFDGIVANNTLYLGFNATDGGGAVRIVTLSSTLSLGTPKILAGVACTEIALSADETQNRPTIWVAFHDSVGASHLLRAAAFNPDLVTLLAVTSVLSAPFNVYTNLTCSAQNSVCTILTETSGTPLLQYARIHQDGTVPDFFGAGIVYYNCGLASKSFLYNGSIYVLAAFSSANQPSFFLLHIRADGSVLDSPIIAKLAYQNGGGLLTLNLPSVSVSGTTASVPYLFKDQINSVNFTQGAVTSAAVYAQTGINLVSFTFTTENLTSAEIGSNLHLSGGVLWAYDGYQSVEQGFHLYPEGITAVWSATGGAMVAKPDTTTNTNAYFYQVTFEWSDNQGNLIRSAPSIPVAVTTTGSGSAGSVTLTLPCLHLTAKQNVKIVIYRWSVGQQNYYRATSLTSPLMNDPFANTITYLDTLADASILGNDLIYTTGGIVENIGAPSVRDVALYRNRLFVIDAEDPNLLWYSKLVVEGAPVEMSDLFTLYISPTSSVNGSSGELQCCYPMDDKLILFKKDALLYLVGAGPDSTGANNDFSEAVLINSTVGSANPNSLVFQPEGIMFQSDKGIWLLGRDLSTRYIGAPVEDFTNAATVLSAVAVPGTNQVRFALSSGLTLMYDYFFAQWSTFTTNSISSTICNSVETYLDPYGKVYQESPGLYLDGDRPVLLSFTTGWINVAGLQGFERAYFFYLLGTFYSPHRLQVQIAYDYNPSPSQSAFITPDNYSAAYGGDAVYGAGSFYGGPSNLEQWQVYFTQQKCQAFQITVSEIFDASFGVNAGAGFTMSGVNCVVGLKGSYPRLKSSRSVS